MTKRIFFKTPACVFTFFSIGLFFFFGEINAQPVRQKPNVLFIAADDMNAWISPLKKFANVRTPNLDRLAKMSTLFTHAYCASPACAPSRLAVMTGVHPVRSGVMSNSNADGPQWRKIPVLKDIPTIEQFFKKNGYHTLAGGKIYHSLAPPWTLLNQADPDGWDFWFPSVHVPIPYQVRAPDRFILHPEWKGNMPNPYFTWAPLNVKDEKMADYITVDWARYEISQKQDKPLFLAVGLFKPHMPWEVPQKYFDMYPLSSIPDLKVKENDLEDAFDHGRRLWHRWVVDNRQWKQVIQAYLACLTFADAQLGRLLDAWQAAPLSKNAIIVFWSDHGMHFGEKENWEKFTLWEEATHVPLMFSVTGQPAHKDATPVSLMDIYPTLAELIGEPVPPHCDGQSLVPQIRGEQKDHDSPLIAYNFNVGSKTAYYNMETGPAYAIVNAGYRYIYYPVNGLEELYDLKKDSLEWDNTAYKPGNKSVITGFRKQLQNRVPKISYPSGPPKGYHIDELGTIHKIHFIPLAQLEYPRQKKSK